MNTDTKEIDMYLCSSGHEEVCYDGGRCPVCEELNNIKNKDREISDLERKLDSAGSDIDSLKEALAQAQSGGGQ
jgi:hypothetical protein